MTPLLSVERINVHHGQLHAVRDFSLHVDAGEKVAVIGANGAGKSTLMRAIAGTHSVTSGRILLDGDDITRMHAGRRVEAGIALVPEGRRLFRSLSLEENLLTGTYRKRPGDWELEVIYDLFPWMAERRGRPVTRLSGGEQQAVAIGRALLSNPRVLLIDELSLGLAPSVVARIYGLVPRIVETGCSVLFVEQNVAHALSVADRALCLLEGRTVLTGIASELERSVVEDAYFGVAGRRPQEEKGDSGADS